MLMSDNKKKGIVALVIKKIGKGPGEEMKEQKPNDDGFQEDHSIGYEAAVDEMFTDIEQKDKIGFQHALKNFIWLCFEEFEHEPHEEWGEEKEHEEESEE